jgi:hypothetical protein
MTHVKKPPILLYIAVLMSFTLACGIPSALPNAAPAAVAPKLSAAPTPPAQVVEMVVTGRLNIRDEPDYKSGADPDGLERGQVVKVYLSCTGGEMRDWVAIDADCTEWVNAAWLGK